MVFQQFETVTQKVETVTRHGFNLECCYNLGFSTFLKIWNRDRPHDGHVFEIVTRSWFRQKHQTHLRWYSFLHFFIHRAKKVETVTRHGFAAPARFCFARDFVFRARKTSRAKTNRARTKTRRNCEIVTAVMVSNCQKTIKPYKTNGFSTTWNRYQQRWSRDPSRFQLGMLLTPMVVQRF